MSWLSEPFTFAFFGRALVAGVVVGDVRRAGRVHHRPQDVLHRHGPVFQSVLGGVAVSQAIGLGLYPGALAATAVAAGAINRISRRRGGLHADAAIGLVATSLFALGVAVISANRSRDFNVTNLLFGNVLGVTDLDLTLAVATAVGFAAALWWFYKPLVFTTFDPAVARAQGVRTGLIETVFNIMVIAVVIVSLRVLGVLLIAAALVLPAATARLASASFSRVITVSTGLGTVAGIVGLYVSYHFDIASGPAIVLTHAVLFTAVYLATAAAKLRRQHTPGTAHA